MQTATLPRTPHQAANDAAYRMLMSDYGYRLDGDQLIQNGIRGFTSDQMFRRGCRNLMDAAEMLCPIVHDDEYTERLIAIGKPRD